MQGKWYLEDHPLKVGWTRVYYQCDLMLFGYAPAIVKKLLTAKGLSSSIEWVQRESEKRAPRDLSVIQLEEGHKSVSAFGAFAGIVVFLMAAGVIARRGKPRAVS